MKYLKYFTVILFVQFLSSYAYGQSNRWILKGKVIDSLTEEPIPYATVVVKAISSNETVNGRVTDDNGVFLIRNQQIGAYSVEIIFVGYDTFIRRIEVTSPDVELDLGTIKLLESNQNLGEVEVLAERSTIEQKIDRKVINIGKDLATIGPNAIDLMSNLPSVDVDPNGGISLRGNSNLMILVNGKPTNQNAEQILQQIPSNSIKQIELITNPSAKYVPDGTSGLINIVLYKNSNLGFNGNINSGLTVGNKVRHNAAINLNYNTSKLNYYVNYAHTGGISPFWGGINRFDLDSDENWYSENDDRTELVKTGIDYFISNKTTLSGYIIKNKSIRNSSRSADVLFNNVDNANFNLSSTSAFDNTNWTYNLDLLHKFNDKSNVEFEGDYSKFSGSEDAQFFLSEVGSLNNESKEFITTDRVVGSYNVDYQLEIDEKTIFETGLEARIQKTKNSYTTTQLNLQNAEFDLDRDIFSAYFNLQKQKDKWSYQLGVRLEDFRVYSNLKTSDLPKDNFNDNFFNVYPTIFVSYTPNPSEQKDVFNLAVNRRVDRPNLDQLNPIRVWGSARVTNVGNPGLIPQFTTSAEINYTKQIKLGSITSGLFYRQISDEITRFGFNDIRNPGNILFTYENYEDNTAYGFELSSNLQLSSWWSITSSFDLYSRTQKGFAVNEYREVNNRIYNFRTNQNFKITENLSIQIISLYRGPSDNLQWRTLSTYYVNIGGSYKLFEEKGTLSVSYNDIFYTQRLGFDGDSPVRQYGLFTRDTRTLFVGYTHTFGNGKIKVSKRKKRDKNETRSVEF